MRKHYIDNLRWLAVLLLIPYHAAQSWNVWGEPNYMIFDGSKVISSFTVFFSPYYMPLLFLLAGVSTRFSLEKRTYRQYIAERAKRLLVPLVFGTLVLMPVMTFMADRHNCGYSSGFIKHYPIFFTKFTDLTGADGGFSIGQFWFLLFLFVISLLSTGIIRLQKKIAPRINSGLPFPLICALGLPLPLIGGWLSIGGKSLAEYTYVFLLGYYVFSGDKVIEKLKKHSAVFLAAGLAACALNVYLYIWSPVKRPGLNTAFNYAAEWFMLLALMGTGRKYLDFSGRVTDYMSSRSFPFFSFHFIWVVAMQYLFSGVFRGSTALLYAVPVIIAYMLTFINGEIFVRVPALAFLIGARPVKRNT